VSDTLEHRDCAEALGAYALGALPDLENDRVRRHLASCRQCRAELEGLRAAVDALPASVPQIDPPPELKARLMEIVDAEAEVLRAAGDPADQPPPGAPPRRRHWWRAFLGSRPALALAGACVVALAVLVVLVSSGGESTRTIQAQVGGPLLSAHARAALKVTGTRAELHVTGLPTPPANHVNELWVKRGSASPRPAGTFVLRSGSVQVAGAVRAGDLVLVTVEPGAGTAAPTTTPVIVAKA
jgi:anti-sigma factor RsiW